MHFKFKSQNGQTVTVGILAMIEDRRETWNGRTLRVMTKFVKRMHRSALRRAKLPFLVSVARPDTESSRSTQAVAVGINGRVDDKRPPTGNDATDSRIENQPGTNACFSLRKRCKQLEKQSETSKSCFLCCGTAAQALALGTWLPSLFSITIIWANLSLASNATLWDHRLEALILIRNELRQRAFHYLMHHSSCFGSNYFAFQNQQEMAKTFGPLNPQASQLFCGLNKRLRSDRESKQSILKWTAGDQFPLKNVRDERCFSRNIIMPSKIAEDSNF
jgi:hypothetical protein